MRKKMISRTTGTRVTEENHHQKPEYQGYYAIKLYLKMVIQIELFEIRMVIICY